MTDRTRCPLRVRSDQNLCKRRNRASQDATTFLFRKNSHLHRKAMMTRLHEFCSMQNLHGATR
jgi:hypothetical protein